MESELLFSRILAQLFEVPILPWDGSDEQLAAFEKINVFWPQMQPQLTAENLRIMLDAAKENQIYIVEDFLSIYTVFLRFGTQLFLIGPFVAQEWDEADSAARLTQNKVPAAHLVSFKLYYCSYRVVNPNELVRTVQAVIKGLCPDLPPYSQRVLSSLASGDPEADYDSEPLDFIQAEIRYKAENDFIRMIKQGNESGAMKALRRMYPLSTGLKLPHITNSNHMTGAAIMRTLTRKAAEAAGVHPAVVDAISQANSQRSYAARTADEIARINPIMVHEFCSAVREVLQEHYSPPVRRTVDYIRLHLNYPMSPDKLAEIANVSPGHLSHLFKAETGKSILKFIAAERCKKAAELLSTTDLEIQKISMYVGYPDNNYFVKVFKSVYQDTPGEYRRKHPQTF